MAKSLTTIRHAVSSILGVDQDAIGLDMNELDFDGWDSAANVNILFLIEEELGIEIEVGRLANVKNIGEMAAEIDKMMDEA
ncbi:hypothetical protein ASG19_21710 [Rhizobium sp. Leaf306]|uniref:phosphopantetheine-binding protein n=1 Tax=Rhizobium sp. Leaf306 TaxID=1736330 RepID=UPI000715AB50|nr:phosphopantetheine-binding protein [Rhizobium sp. Leaf306]KQQ33910.1 hypothetical protein ASG19_21710 [Rhizobium sp. Leaf306]